VGRSRRRLAAAGEKDGQASGGKDGSMSWKEPWSEEKVSKDLQSGEISDLLDMITMEKADPTKFREEMDEAKKELEKEIGTDVASWMDMDVTAEFEAELDRMKTIMTDCEIDLTTEESAAKERKKDGEGGCRRRYPDQPDRRQIRG
jgi:hypothetical protein